MQENTVQQNRAKFTVVLTKILTELRIRIRSEPHTSQSLPSRKREQIRPGLELASKQTSRIRTGVSIKKLPIRNINSKEGPDRHTT
jgi:hypothetical protein